MTAATPVQDYVVNPPIKLIAGDRWDISCTYSNPDGSPADLTVTPPFGEFCSGGANQPIELRVGSGIKITGPGVAVFSLLGVVTRRLPQLDPAAFNPVRLVMGVMDSTGETETVVIQPILAENRRVVLA